MKTEYHKIVIDTKNTPCTVLVVFYATDENLAIFEIDNFRNTEDLRDCLRGFNRDLSDSICYQSVEEFANIFDKFKIPYELASLSNYSYLEDCFRQLIKTINQ